MYYTHTPFLVVEEVCFVLCLVDPAWSKYGGGQGTAADHLHSLWGRDRCVSCDSCDSLGGVHV